MHISAEETFINEGTNLGPRHRERISREYEALVSRNAACKALRKKKWNSALYVRNRING